MKNMRGVDTVRMENLSDSVFAVALTLLVLNIAVPVVTSLDDSALRAELIDLWPKALVYASSFFVISVFWLGHRLMFHYVESANVRLMTLNSFLLLTVSFVPFAANLIGNYPWTASASLVYGATLFVASLMYIFVWKYALVRGFVSSKAEGDFIKKSNRVLLIGPMLYGIATLCVFVSSILSFFLFILIPVLYVLPGPVDDLLPERE